MKKPRILHACRSNETLQRRYPGLMDVDVITLDRTSGKYRFNQLGGNQSQRAEGDLAAATGRGHQIRFQIQGRYQWWYSWSQIPETKYKMQIESLRADGVAGTSDLNRNKVISDGPVWPIQYLLIQVLFGGLPNPISLFLLYHNFYERNPFLIFIIHSICWTCYLQRLRRWSRWRCPRQNGWFDMVAPYVPTGIQRVSQDGDASCGAFSKRFGSVYADRTFR